jgi:ketosteroid isomerase-like protein
MKTMLSMCVASALLLTSGCNKTADAADTAKIADGIKAQEAQWEKDYAAKDVDALADHYAADAAMVAPGDPIASSEAERRKGLNALVSDPNFGLTFAADRVEVAQSGDMAYSRGHYSIRLTDKATSKPTSSDGTYLTVWRKQSDGSWKAVEDFITPGPAAAPAPAETK